MTESEKNAFNADSMVDTWLRNMSKAWSGMTKPPFSMTAFADAPDKQNKKDKPPGKSKGFDQYIESNMKVWQALTSAMSQPETLASVFKGVGLMPDMLLKMIQPVFNNVSSMQQQVLEQIENTGRISEAFNSDRMSEESANIFANLYDAEFRKFFNIPQLGLAREHQEKFNRFMDRFNLMSTAMAGFLQVIFRPFQNSYVSFQEKIAELAKKNELPADPKEYYQVWLKLLEGEYMMLFKTPDYLSCLGKTVSAVAEYNIAKRDLSNDLLGQFSIPSPKDIEGVYKDLYDLKKRVRNLEKAIVKN